MSLIRCSESVGGAHEISVFEQSKDQLGFTRAWHAGVLERRREMPAGERANDTPKWQAKVDALRWDT